MATTKKEFNEEELHDGYKRVHWNWECDSAGAASDVSEYFYDGVLLGLTTKPGSGSDAPTTLYDLVITDDDGLDLLNGLGADRSATAQERKAHADGLGVAIHTKLHLAVTNAGDITKGQARVDLG